MNEFYNEWNYDFKEYLGMYSLHVISGATFMSLELKKEWETWEGTGILVTL